jgi:hypothetical protein
LSTLGKAVRGSLEKSWRDASGADDWCACWQIDRPADVDDHRGEAQDVQLPGVSDGVPDDEHDAAVGGLSGNVLGTDGIVDVAVRGAGEALGQRFRE